VKTAHDVIQCARGMLGTPWMHQGRMPGVALDCAGLVICVARQLGIVSQQFDINGYSRVPDGTMPDKCKSVLLQTDALRLGAVVMLQVDKDPQHLGIIGDYRHGGFILIHAAGNAGKAIETRLMFARNQVLRGIYLFDGVDYGATCSI